MAITPATSPSAPGSRRRLRRPLLRSDTPHLRQMIADAKVELIPMKSLERAVSELRPGSSISMTCSPAKSIEATLDESETAARGRPPRHAAHLGADGAVPRSTWSRSTLDSANSTSARSSSSAATPTPRVASSTRSSSSMRSSRSTTRDGPDATPGRPHRLHVVPRHPPADHQRATPRGTPPQAGDDPRRAAAPRTCRRRCASPPSRSATGCATNAPPA